jgi:predicted MFS family arabinose efflux permease
MYFTWYTARGISTFILPLYLSAVGIPIVEIGVALGIAGASLLVFELAWGFVLDRFGVGRTLPAVEALAVLTFLALPLVRTTSEAYVVSFFLGMTSPVMVVIGRSLLVGESESSGWGTGFGLLGAAVTLGFGAGALVGGFASSSYGYAITFYAAAVLSIVPYPLYSLMRPREKRTLAALEATPAAGQGGLGMDWISLSVLGVVSVPLFMAGAFFTGIMQLIVTQTPSLGANNNDAAVMVALFSLFSAFFQPLLGWKLGPHARRYIAVGLLLNFFVFLGLTSAETMLEIDALAVAEAFCFSIVSPLSLSLLMVRMPKSLSGRVMGAYGAAEDVGIILGPVLGAVVWANYGLQATYETIGLPLLGVLVFYLVAHYRTK